MVSQNRKIPLSGTSIDEEKVELRIRLIWVVFLFVFGPLWQEGTFFLPLALRRHKKTRTCVRV